MAGRKDKTKKATAGGDDSDEPAAADAEKLAKTPVTLGVVLILGSALLGAIGYVANTAIELQKDVGVFRAQTQVQLERIQKDIDKLSDARDEQGGKKK